MASFLVDASLPKAVAELIRSDGQEATDVREIGLGAARDEVIADYANVHHLCLISRDRDFADILMYPPQSYAGIVVICAPANANRQVVLRMIESFLGQHEIIGRLSGRLAVVEPHRVRLRPP